MTDLQPSPQSSSHPAIRYKHLPIVEGPLSRFESARPTILSDVVQGTVQEFSKAPLDLLLGEALYAERVRMKRDRGNLFTASRRKRDRETWNSVQSGLLRSSAEIDRKRLLDKVVAHYAEEIGGHFDPAIYRLATRLVPFGFSWLLNAASVRRFVPWGMTESLQSRIVIQGEIPALKKLAQNGTILLVPTHQSNIDSVLIGYVIHLMSLPPFAYGAGLNLFSNPALSFFMSNLGAYTVDRQKSNAIYKHTLKNYSTRILREGIHSIFFPGGGRSRSGAIESRLKLGLLGTALEAQIENLRGRVLKPNIYIVPMAMSYHFVLEAGSLIEDYLAEAGKHRFIMMDDESWQTTKVLHFFWKIFSSQVGVTVRIGRALDVFGNFVDEEGQSMGPNGSTIEPARWLKSGGELAHDLQRDQEYTRELGNRLVDRFHRENTVLTSHLVAFTLFETLRSRYPDLDLYRFLRLSLDQRALPYADFLKAAEAFHSRLQTAAGRGELFLASELQTSDTETWVKDGLKQLGVFHNHAVIRLGDGAIWSEDLNLLYYYRNRLSGYSLSVLAEPGMMGQMAIGRADAKGFLE